METQTLCCRAKSLSRCMRLNIGYRLAIINFTSTYSKGSSTKLLQQQWAFSYASFPTVDRLQAGVGLLTISMLRALRFSPADMRVASLRVQISGSKTLNVVYIRIK